MSHPLVARLADPDPASRRDACVRAAEDPSAVLLVEALCGALGDADRSVARAASDALVAIAARDAEVAKALHAALRQPDFGTRWWAGFALARLEPPPLRLLPTLLEGLEHRDGDLRWSAAKLLVELGRLDGSVLPVVLHFAGGDERPAARRMAVFALRELAPDLPQTTAALLAASRAGDLEVRRAALSALAAVRESTEQACARLAEALHADPDVASRGMAATALGQLGARGAAGTPGAAADLRRAAEQDPEPAVRAAAERALARFAP